ncbi:MAG: maleylpyruvate isomerase family mycothiol-dependent enzyme [Acidimicrobiales bacterium]
MAASIWPTIHAERQALASDLEALSEEQWETTSLCHAWTVRDTLAHMTATARMTPPQFFAKMMGSGFNFSKMTMKEIASQKGVDPTATLSTFRDAVNLSSHPPGPAMSWLGETLVHSEDIRQPLGITHSYPTDAAVQVADFYKTSNLLIGAKKRITGVTLRATDADWSTGNGPEISGPMISLLMAMCGRKPALEDLSGDGVETLRSR